MIVSTLDEETLADARPELERLRVERRSLDEQIAAEESTVQARTLDPMELTERILATLTDLSAKMKALPTIAMKQMLATVVEKVVVDMESKEIEFFWRPPPPAFFRIKMAPMRCVSQEPRRHQFHIRRISTRSFESPSPQLEAALPLSCMIVGPFVPVVATALPSTGLPDGSGTCGPSRASCPVVVR